MFLVSFVRVFQPCQFLADATQNATLGLVDRMDGKPQLVGHVGRRPAIDDRPPESLPGAVLELGTDQFQRSVPGRIQGFRMPGGAPRAGDVNQAGWWLRLPASGSFIT